MSELTEFALLRQAEYLAGSDSAHRKQQGQIFTPPEIAQFMAGLFDAIPTSFRLLDAGAGAGSLSVAVCERVLRSRKPRQLHINAFETEPVLADLLNSIFAECKLRLEDAGHKFSYSVEREDFISAAAPHLEEQHMPFQAGVPCDFDGVIMNPPYFKLRKDSDHARLMERVVHEEFGVDKTLAECLVAEA